MIKISSRIRDHADLVRPAVGAGVVNTNRDEWLKAKKRQEQYEKQRKLEQRVEGIEKKLDVLINLLKGGKSE